MTMLETRNTIYLQLPDTREEALKGVLTRKASISTALKALQNIRESDVVARAEVLTMTETVKGLMFLSPSGENVYVLRPTTRKINGVSTKMLSVVAVIPVSAVLSFEVVA